MSEPASISANSVPGATVFPPVEPGGFLGLLVLDTRFPRLAGDLGRTDAWAGPARSRTVAGAVPQRVVQDGASLRASGLPARFIAAARQLEREGAFAIASSCGFLVLLQQDLQAAVRVPVATSSLLLLPGLLRSAQQVGVLTVSGERLGAEHLLAAGVPPDRLADVLVQGMPPQGDFARPLLENLPQMDAVRAAAEVVEAALALRRRAPGLATVVLECTNMPPHAQAVQAATGLQVLSLRDHPVLQSAP